MVPFTWIAAAVFFACGCLPVVAAPASKQVVVIGEESAAPFAAAARRALSTLEQAGIQAVHRKLSEVEKSGSSGLGDTALILAIGTEAANWAATNRGVVPAVFAMVLNPVPGLIPSYENPPAGFSGACLNLIPSDVLRLLRKVLPGLKTLGIAYHRRENSISVPEVQAAAAAQGINIIAQEVSSEAEIASGLRSVLPKVDLLWALPDASVFSPRGARIVLQLALERKTPVLGFSRPMAVAGALLSIFPDFDDSGAQAGEIGLRLLSGERGQRLPVARPRKLHVVVNRRVTELLGKLIAAEGEALVEEWLN